MPIIANKFVILQSQVTDRQALQRQPIKQAYKVSIGKPRIVRQKKTVLQFIRLQDSLFFIYFYT